MAIHRYSVIMEMVFDDEDEYTPPSTRDLEIRFMSALKRPMEHLGFESEFEHFEAAKGDLEKAFGLNE